MKKSISRAALKTVGAPTTEEKVMTVEIFKEIVEEAMITFISISYDIVYDTLTNIAGEDIGENLFAELWSEGILFNEGSIDAVCYLIEDWCNGEGYDIDIYDWCENNDIDLEDMLYYEAEQAVEYCIKLLEEVDMSRTPIEKVAYDWWDENYMEVFNEENL